MYPPTPGVWEMKSRLFPALLLAATMLASSLTVLVAATAGVKIIPVESLAREWLGSMSFSGSLHATTYGMKYWYEHGAGKITGIPYEQLFCKHCHATCETCHAETEGDKIVDYTSSKARSTSTCFKCHGRQKLASKLIGVYSSFYGEAHEFEIKHNCLFCHTSREVHAPVQAKTMFDVLQSNCEYCHTKTGLGPYPYDVVPEHRQHLHNIACITCHSRTTVTCYCCHLDKAYESYAKTGKVQKKFKLVTGWLFLARDKRTGKIVPADFMLVKWGDKVRVDFAQMFSHIIVGKGLTCKECHNKELLEKFKPGSTVKIAWTEGGDLEALKGVIPLVEGVRFEMPIISINPDGSVKAEKYITVTISLENMIAYTEPLSAKDLEKMLKASSE